MITSTVQVTEMNLDQERYYDHHLVINLEFKGFYKEGNGTKFYVDEGSLRLVIGDATTDDVNNLFEMAKSGQEIDLIFGEPPYDP